MELQNNAMLSGLEALRGHLAERVAAGKLDLPVLPEVATEVMTAAAQEDCDARQLTELIRRDQSMASHLLRVANSPLYLPRTPIVSLQQAVSRLGIGQIRQIAIVISCQTRAFKVKGHERMVRELFRHALASGIFAQEIARIRRWNVEEAFLAGLLHDVGRAVLLQAIVDLQIEFGVTLGDADIEATIDPHHATVGSTIATKWLLPPRLAETILYHHMPQEAPNVAPIATLTNFADALASWLCGMNDVDEIALREHPTLVALNLYPEDVEALLAKRDEFAGMLQALE